MAAERGREGCRRRWSGKNRAAATLPATWRRDAHIHMQSGSTPPTICGGAIASSASSTPPAPIVAPSPPPPPTSLPPLRSCIQPPLDAPGRLPPPSDSAFASPPSSPVDCRASPPSPPPSSPPPLRAGSPLHWYNGHAPLAWLPSLSSHRISPRWLCAIVLSGTIGLAPYRREVGVDHRLCGREALLMIVPQQLVKQIDSLRRD